MRKRKKIYIGGAILTMLFMTNIVSIKSVYAINVPSGFNIEKLNISGMNKEDALKTIKSFEDRVDNSNISLSVNNNIVNLNTAEIGMNIANYNDLIADIDKSTAGNIIDRYHTEIDYQKEPKNVVPNIVVDDSKFDAVIDKKLSGILGQAVDATIKRENGKFIITDSKDGVKLDKEQTKKDIISAIEDPSSSITGIQAPVTVDEPKIKATDLEQIKDVLGTYTTDFKTSSASRATNVEVGAAKINGHVIMPGEVLSGYECMKPFTIANGYKVAGAYENGRVVDSIGGGACQIATTLYNASLRAEVGIKQRQNHSMVVGYAPASADAAIAGTYKDIKITNNRSTPIYVEANAANRKLTFTIWGKEDRPSNRKVEFVSEILSETPSGVTYQDDPTLPLGKEVKVEGGHTGRKSRLWKVVTVNGKVESKELVSSDTYRMSNSIYKRGTMPVADAQVDNGVSVTIDDNNVSNSINTVGPSGAIKNNAPNGGSKANVSTQGPSNNSSNKVAPHPESPKSDNEILVPVGP